MPTEDNTNEEVRHTHRRASDTVVIPQGSMGMGPYQWVVNTSLAGVVSILLVSMIYWVLNSVTEATKTTNGLYMEAMKRAEEDRKERREDAIRIWQAITETTRINAENTQIHKRTQDLLEQNLTASKGLAEEVKKLQDKKNQ